MYLDSFSNNFIYFLIFKIIVFSINISFNRVVFLPYSITDCHNMLMLISRVPDHLFASDKIQEFGLLAMGVGGDERRGSFVVFPLISINVFSITSLGTTLDSNDSSTDLDSYYFIFHPLCTEVTRILDILLIIVIFCNSIRNNICTIILINNLY